MKARIIRVDSFESFVKLTRLLPQKEWAFRGHSNAKWPIESTLARYFRRHRTNIAQTWQDRREIESIYKFRKAAHQFLTHRPSEDDLLSWLAVMRHFGAPTRLIDFTYSPYVALFFVLSEPNREFTPFRVHAVHVCAVMEGMWKALGKSKEYKLSTDDLLIGRSSKQKHEFAALFEGHWHNPRQVAQQGLFMITSRIETNVESFLKGCDERQVGRIKEPWLIFEFAPGRKRHKEVIKNLLAANITDASLFPGLEGLAHSLFMRLYEPRTVVDFYWKESAPEKPEAVMQPSATGQTQSGLSKPSSTGT